MKQIILPLAMVMTMLCTSTFADNNSEKPTILNSEDLAIVESIEDIIQPGEYHNFRDGMRYSKRVFEETKKGTVAFLGGSITAMDGWRNMVCDYLTRRFPDTEFTFIAAGIGANGSTSGSFRFYRDVASMGKVDLLFEEAAVNDRSEALRRNSQDRIKGMEGIVRQARVSNPNMDIIIMNFVDPDKMNDYNSGKTPQEILDFDRVAEHYNIPTINLAKEITDRINAGEFTWDDDFKNLHPSPAGQRIYYRSMHHFLESAFKNCGVKVADETKYELPERVDPNCYDRAQLIPVNDIKLGKGWSFDPSLQPTVQNKNYRPNTINVPAIVAKESSKELTFRFKGSTIGFLCASGPDAGAIEYSIDGGDYRLFQLWTPPNPGGCVARYFILENELSEGNHTLKMRLAPSDKADEKSVGNACMILNFLTNNKQL